MADLEWDLDFPYEVFMSPKAAQDGQTYVYNLNKYVKTIFKEDVTLYAANDFKVEG